MKRGQLGFGAIEALLFLILLSILGFTGYYVYHSRNNTNSTYNSALNSSASTPVSKSSTAAQSGDPAVAFTQNFYDQYIKADSKEARDQLVNNSGSENSIPAYEKATASDPIVCGQNTPKSVTVTRNGGTDTSPILNVRENYDSPVDIKVQLINGQYGYRIDVITCPRG